MQRSNTHHPYDYRPRIIILASIGALLSSIFLVVIKSYAYNVSGSAVMLASLVDSIIDVAVSFILFLAVRYSLKPADSDHRHGHGKIEGIASLFQSAFMMCAALFLAYEAYHKFTQPYEVTAHHISIGVSLVAIAMSIFVVSLQKYALRRAPSLLIQADQAHYKTDILLNISVIITLYLELRVSATWIDPVFALLIAGYFIFNAYYIGRRSVDMLMDRELGEDIRNHIIHIVKEYQQVYGMHDLRTRASGMAIHISFDVELEPDLTLCQAHDIVRRLEHAILGHYPNAEILIHMDPLGDTEDTRHSLDN